MELHEVRAASDAQAREGRRRQLLAVLPAAKPSLSPAIEHQAMDRQCLIDRDGGVAENVDAHTRGAVDT